MSGRWLASVVGGALASMSLGATYYVAPQGRDGATGSRSDPWSLEQGGKAARPGDTVVLTKGVYRLREPFAPTASGTADAWIRYVGESRDGVVLDAAASKPKDARDSTWGGAMTVHGPAFVAFERFTVRNSYRAGIHITAPSHHVDLRGLKVQSSFAPGIAAWNFEQLRVIGCEVVDANSPKLRLFGDPTRETPHEAISVAGVNGFEVAYNHVHHCEKEGIDVKEISRHGVVHHNYVHDLKRQALYVDAWFGLLEDVTFASNLVHDCEWGFVISVEGRGSELRNVRARHNVLYRLRASGIYFGTWGTNALRSDILIAHNTVWKAGNPKHWAGATGALDLRSKSSKDVRIVNNILTGGACYDLATFLDPATERRKFADLGILIEHNLLSSRRSETEPQGEFGYGRVFGWPGYGAVVADPLFRDRERGDLRLATGSPAIGAGKDVGFGLDLGAFARGADRLPAVASPLSGFPAYSPDLRRLPSILRS